MYYNVRQNWWLLLVRGIAATALGVIALAWPQIALDALVMLFGIFFFADGLLLSAYAFQNRMNISSWFPLLITGLLGIAAGAVAFLWPTVTAVAFILLFAVWAIASGFLQTLIAVPLRRRINGGWLWIVTGILTLLVGLMLFFWPRAGLVALAWVIGIYAAVYGIFTIWLSLRLRTHV